MFNSFNFIFDFLSVYYLLNVVFFFHRMNKIYLILCYFWF
jgi:hypothetical protein